jgi:sialic acid synthase SpsE
MRANRSTMVIGGRRISAADPLFVIAEIGLNHGGSRDRALAMVDAAAAAGASAVKLQTLVAADLTADPPARDFFARFELDEAAHVAVTARARAHGLAVISTPLSLAAVDLLERIGVDAYKIASGDITFLPLIERCAATGAPLIVSSGASTLDDVRRAVEAAWRGGATAVAVLHCVSAYPTPDGSENLAAIATLGDALDVPVGLSDHAPDTFGVPVAVALGACLYERHLVLGRDDDAVDAAVSSTPGELGAVVVTAARAKRALGSGEKVILPAESHSTVNRRGLYAARALGAGAVVRAEDVIALRPATALSPAQLTRLVGVRLLRDVPPGAPFLASDIEAVHAG